MKNYTFNENTYTLIKDYKNGFDEEVVKEKLTDYFDNFDYVVGDWAYSKLRLKGFYDSKNKLVKDYNNYNNLDKYLEENCAVDAKYFVIRKISVKH